SADPTSAGSASAGSASDPSKNGEDDASAQQHPTTQQNQTFVPMIGIPMGGMGGGRGGGSGSRSRSRKGARRKMDVPSPAIKPAPGLIPEREPRILTPGSDGKPRPSATAPNLAAPKLAAPAKPSLPAMPPAPEPGWVPPVSVAESLTAAKPSDQKSEQSAAVPLSPIAEALSAAKEDERKA
ncbi:hypothetical protein AB0J52_08155, partial [Spirillospora sp. NPDC049652]